MNVTSANFVYDNYIENATPIAKQALFGGGAMSITSFVLYQLAQDAMKEKSPAMFVVMAPLAFVPSFLLSQVSKMQKAVVLGTVGSVGLAAVTISRFLSQCNLLYELPAHRIWEAPSRVCFNWSKFRRIT